MTVASFSLAALVIGATIYSSRNNLDVNKTSPVMAIAVDAVALFYLLWATWDEYTGKPLGLRSPKAKVRVVLLDLNFIIFDSANLSLAFEAVVQFSSQCGSDLPVCGKQAALASVLLAALIAWVLTFVVSILR